MSENLELIKEKIQKLLNHAQSAKDIGNIDEAAAFTSKVNALLLEYNLEVAEIENFQTAPEVHEDKCLDVKKSAGKWMTTLISVLCNYNYCSLIQNENKFFKQYHVIIIGKKENTEVVKYLYSVLKSRFESIALSEFKIYLKELRKQLEISRDQIHKYKINEKDLIETKTGYQLKKPHKFAKGALSRSQYNKSFLIGAVRGVAMKLEADKKAAMGSENGQKITSLIKLHDAAITDYMNNVYADIPDAQVRKKTVNSKVYNKGIEVGKNTSLAKGVANGDTVSTKMLK